MKASKRTAFAILAAGLLVSTPAMAETYASQSADKFGRGLANSATGWGEIPKNIVKESRDSNALIGITYGTVKGAAHTVGRTVVGAFDLATFFVPSRGFVHSTYVWQHTDVETTYGTN